MCRVSYGQRFLDTVEYCSCRRPVAFAAEATVGDHTSETRLIPPSATKTVVTYERRLQRGGTFSPATARLTMSTCRFAGPRDLKALGAISPCLNRARGRRASSEETERACSGQGPRAPAPSENRRYPQAILDCTFVDQETEESALAPSFSSDPSILARKPAR